MSHVRVAALVAALALLLAGCSDGKKPANLPIKAYNELEYSTIDHLDKAIAAVKNSPAAKGGHGGGTGPTEDRRDIGPAPCPGAENAFHVTGYDVAMLSGSAHRAVLQDIGARWTNDGYLKAKEEALGNGGADLILESSADGFTVEWSSSDDRSRLVVTVTSPCVVAPDGQYPH